MFDAEERYTQKAIEILSNVSKALEPVYEKYKAEGYLYRDITSLVIDEAHYLTSMLVLNQQLENRKLAQEKKQKEEYTIELI